MAKLYSYVLRVDDGAAPNPFWGACTLAICKPAIRRTAQIGDWIIGTGSKNTILKDSSKIDLSGYIVYAMKVSDKKTLREYDIHCLQNLPQKIPNWRPSDWRLRMGDCIYSYSNTQHPTQRKGVHDASNRKRDLNGHFALISNHFYYFGEAAIPLPPNLQSIIKRNQGHLVIKEEGLVKKFEAWISQFKKNRIYGDPQLRWRFDRQQSKSKKDFCSPVPTPKQPQK